MSVFAIIISACMAVSGIALVANLLLILKTSYEPQ